MDFGVFFVGLNHGEFRKMFQQRKQIMRVVVLHRYTKKMVSQNKNQYQTSCSPGAFGAKSYKKSSMEKQTVGELDQQKQAFGYKDVLGVDKALI